MSLEALRILPPVQDVLGHSSVVPLVAEYGRESVLCWIREALQNARQRISVSPTEISEVEHSAVAVENSLPSDREGWTDYLAELVVAQAQAAEHRQLCRVINATGVILHTGLGRAPLSASARQSLVDLSGYCNVEIDLATSERRYRGYQLESAFRTLTGCEDVLIVNNNAAATLLALQALCAGREVIISRGQLIEIGGSFRLPEIFNLSGTVLREVGTTNRTHLEDYQQVYSASTAAVMHVHPSNYRIVGFSETPSIAELVSMAHERGLIAIDDIGSGALVDVTQFGLPTEPTFQNSLVAGADVVLGSGDKLLGGPQCGIILGKREFVDRIRRHPLARAVRVDKLTLAALQATLESYLRGEATVEIPTLAMLAAQLPELRRRGEAILTEIGEVSAFEVSLEQSAAAVGGGSLPGVELPTIVLRLQHSSLSANDLSQRLRLGTIRVVGRIQQEAVFLDLRSVLPEDDSRLALAIRLAAVAGAQSRR